MTGSQVIDAEEDRHKLVVEYKDALHRPFTDIEIARHIGNSWNINGLRHLTDGHE